MPSFPPEMSEEKMLAEEALLAEPDLFHYRGDVYYRHESGVIVRDSISNLANGRQARLLTLVSELPAGAEVYELIEGSMREHRTDAWTNRVDIMLREQTDAPVAARHLEVVRSESPPAG